MTARLVIFFDCDNTLIDNDAAKDEFNRRLLSYLGRDDTVRFWTVYESVRSDRGVVDIPLTIERFGVGDAAQRAALTEIFFDFPFDGFVYPDVPAVIAHGQSLGTVAVLSDGDQVFQRHKIRQSGLEELVAGAVYVFDHKEIAIQQVIRELPADHYVTVDDKPHLLTALEAAVDAPLTTVFVHQGKYARTGADPTSFDIVLESIGGFLKLTVADLMRFSAA